MSIEAAKKLAEYRLFRPLALKSEHYQHYKTDKYVAKTIAKWASNILLGGKYYDLKVKPKGVFQVQSNRLNRIAYLIPVWDAVLVRKIVLDANNKTAKARKGCGIGNLEGIEFAGGVLKLSRVFFRGTKKYLETHKSKSGWFVEDRYHMDVFACCPKKTSIKTTGKSRNGKRKKSEFRAAFRVFHNSVGCLAIPCWAPHNNIQKYNESIKTNVNEYYPEPEDIIMNWHEVAFHLNLHNTGIYALANILAEWESGRFDTDVHKCVGVCIDGEYNDQNQRHVIRLIRDFDPSQPLPLELTRSYERFWSRKFTLLLIYPPPNLYVPDTYANTLPPSGGVGIGLITYLSEKLGDAGQHIGNGFFLLKSADGLKLAAGTGNWGSPEYNELTISTQANGGSTSNSDVGITGQGATGLILDAVRYVMKDIIEAEIQACRTDASSAECQECVSESTGQIFHNVGIAADVVDFLAGVAACIIASLCGQPWVCGLTIPIAIAAAKDFWDNTIGGYDYAEDMCSGLPDQSPVYDDSTPKQDCVVTKIPNFTVWTDGSLPCDSTAMEDCIEHIGERNKDEWILKDAWCKEIEEEAIEENGQVWRAYEVYCRYCKPLNIC